jgi:predicted acetyltransferase
MQDVTLHAAGSEHLDLLGNLMELYIHDLSAIFTQVELGTNGRYGYPGLETYVAGTAARHAFIVHCERRAAGFALAKRGSPFSDDPEVLDIAEFFVLRRFRARGVGRAAACALWERLPGSWTVRASDKNPQAVAFWRRTTTRYTSGAVVEEARSGWTVFNLRSG